MKKTDIAMIILIAGLSVLVSYLIARATPLGNPSSATAEVRVADPIQEGLAPVTTATFPENGINPSVDIYIDEQPQATPTETESPTDEGS